MGNESESSAYMLYLFRQINELSKKDFEDRDGLENIVFVDDFSITGKVTVKKCNERIKALKAKYDEISNVTGIQGDDSRLTIPREPRTVKAGLTSANGGGIINTKHIRNVSTGGRRNEEELSLEQIQECVDYAMRLGTPYEKIRYGNHYDTAYGSEFDMLYIGTDVYPSNIKSPRANDRVSAKGALAHEIVGHRETHLKGWQQENLVLDEIQASIRAARFAPELSYTERITLLRDAAERAHKEGLFLKDIQSKLNIKER